MSLTYQQRMLAIPAYVRIPVVLVFLPAGLGLGVYCGSGMHAGRRAAFRAVCKWV